MIDLLLRGARVIDGTGAPARHGDVGVQGGRIVLDPEGPAKRTIDAEGLALAPGFIDLHTHYDAQLFWDAAATPSPLHGVTTVMGGNCGFALAPTLPEHSDYLKRLMARVEGMSLTSLELGLPWDWTDFGSWMDKLDGRLGVNAGFLVGHCAIRRLVMGDSAACEEASAEQRRAMVAVLHEALAAGGMGFSTALSPNHMDGDGRPIPSLHAGRQELLELSAAVADHPGTTLGINPAVTALGRFTDEESELLIQMSLLADRPLNWNVLRVSAENPELHQKQLALSDRAAARGAHVVALTVPHPMRLRLDFDGTVFYEFLPGWKDLFRQPPKDRLRALADPSVRRKLSEGAKTLANKTGSTMHDASQWERVTLAEVFSPQFKALEGRKLGDVAVEHGRDPFDLLCDIVVADELRTGLEPELGRTTSEENSMRADVWRSGRAIVGGSDAGAHLDMMCGAVYTTFLLGEAVREQQVISLEEGVHMLTDVPARLYGLRDRGRIADGYHADLVLFDPATIHDKPAHRRSDLPGGASRLYAEAEGVHHVWVNGTEVVKDGVLTGALTGDLIRSGRDTDTVSAASSPLRSS